MAPLIQRAALPLPFSFNTNDNTTSICTYYLRPQNNTIIKYMSVKLVQV
jgi:hypothetical protein